MKKILPAILGLLLLAAPASVQAIAIYTYFTNADNTLTITNYTGSGVVAVPTNINGLTVTSLGDGSHAVFTSNVTSVTIPDSVNSIEDAGFTQCYALTNITFGTNVSSIGYDSFYQCTNLPAVVLPNSLNGIGESAFYDCYALSNVVFGANVTSIDEDAFDTCTNLRSVTIPDNVTYIGEDAFESCYALTNLTIGKGVTAIDEDAFDTCTNLRSVTIPDNVTSLGEDAFEECTALTNLTIGKGITVITEDAFYNCTNLLNVTIPDNVTSLGEDAFEECTALTNVTIGKGVTTIGEDAFYYCTNLRSVTIPDSVTDIGEDAFEECYALTNVTIGKGLTFIAEDLFYECTNLRSVTIPDSVTYIGDDAFEECYALTNLTIGKGVTVIYEDAFYECTNLRSVTIPGNVTYIGEDAFQDCYALTNVTFGASVGNIAYSAFLDCTNLTQLYFQGNAPNVDSTAFQYGIYPHYTNINNLTVYYYAGATGWGGTFDGAPTVELMLNSLQVTLGPNAVIDAGAHWQLDGGANQGSGAILPNLAPGSHTVSFTPVTGWITPTNQTVAITNGGPVSILGLYIPTTTPSDGLILLTNGYGTISKTGLPKILVDGTKYTVKAVPDVNNIFSNWSGGASLPFAVLSTSASYKFTMESNLVLVANFAPNPFNPGIYNGLFSVSNGVTEQTAGMLKGLTIGQTGAYTGDLLINGASHVIKGTFNPSRQTTNVISRSPAEGGPLLVELALSSGDSVQQVTGMVFGTNDGVPWASTNLIADKATNALPSAEYTMLMLPDTNNAPPSSSPGGDGYALITNSAGTAKNPASAIVKIIGALADGTAFSQSVPVSEDGYIPVYASLYANKGLLLGWINLIPTNTAAVGLTWIHPGTSKGLYKNEFTNILSSVQIPISPWTNPPGDVLTNLSKLLMLPIINSTNGVTTNGVTTSTSGNVSGTGVSGSINPKTGLLKVTIGSGASKVTGYGAILLDATNGGGYFLTGTNAQAIELAP